MKIHSLVALLLEDPGLLIEQGRTDADLVPAIPALLLLPPLGQRLQLLQHAHDEDVLTGCGEGVGES